MSEGEVVRSAEVDAYIASFPEPIRSRLAELREALIAVLPGATEKIGYGMPTYWKGENLVHFAGYAGHVGFYPCPSGVEAFAEELAAYPSSKGAIRFPLDRPLPLALAARVAAFRLAEAERSAAGKGRA